jgi:hypothetical protein
MNVPTFTCLQDKQVVCHDAASKHMNVGNAVQCRSAAAAATPPALQYFMPATMRTKQKVSLASALPRLAGYASARWHLH